MKRNYLSIPIVIICVVLGFFPIIVNADNTTKDELTGTIFELPTGWKLRECIKQTQRTSFSNEDKSAYLVFYARDVYKRLREEEPDIKISRKELSELFEEDGFYNEYSMEMAINDIDPVDISDYEIIGKNRYGSFDYYEVSATDDDGSKMYVFNTIDNEVIYTYILLSFDNHERNYQECTDLISTAIYPEKKGISGNFNLYDWLTNPVLVVLSLLITFGVYSGPILFYRFGIVRKPIQRKKAIILVICYAIISLIIMYIIILLLGGATPTGVPSTFYAIINYFVITKGINATESSANHEKSNRSETQAVILMHETEETDAPKIMEVDNNNDALNNAKIQFCPYCGTKLISGAEFCHKCGKASIR